MAKDTFWFSHDYNARNDEKILELRSSFGAEGYGVYWMLIEHMAESSTCSLDSSLLAGLSLSFGIAKAKLQEIIKSCINLSLLIEEDGFLFSKRLNEHKVFRKGRSEDGKKGAASKWKDHIPKAKVKNGLAIPEPSDSHSIANAPPMAKNGKEEERREEERKEEESKEEKKEKKETTAPPVQDSANKISLIVLPWTDEEFKVAWDEWKKYQKEQFRKTMKPKSEEFMLRKLKRLSGGDLKTAIEILKQSQENVWAGIFKLNNDEQLTNFKSGQSRTTTAENKRRGLDAMAQYAEEFLRQSGRAHP